MKPSSRFRTGARIHTHTFKPSRPLSVLISQCWYLFVFQSGYLRRHIVILHLLSPLPFPSPLALSTPPCAVSSGGGPYSATRRVANSKSEGATKRSVAFGKTFSPVRKCSERCGAMAQSDEGWYRLERDTDIVNEASDLLRANLHLGGTGTRQQVAVSASPERPLRLGPGEALSAPPLRHVRLNWRPGQGGHRPSSETIGLLQEVGGQNEIRKFTEAFYQLCFRDPHIDKLIRDHADPHGERFANWITEKFGGGDVWTAERAGRKICPFQSHGHTLQTPHDRSSAHFAAWHSPKREPEKFGRHFKLDDCRVWMR